MEQNLENQINLSWSVEEQAQKLAEIILRSYKNVKKGFMLESERSK